MLYEEREAKLYVIFDEISSALDIWIYTNQVMSSGSLSDISVAIASGAVAHSITETRKLHQLIRGNLLRLDIVTGFSTHPYLTETILTLKSSIKYVFALR